MRRRASRRTSLSGTILAFLAVLALVLLPSVQAAAMARHGGTTPPPTAAPVAGADQISVVICTLYGYKVVSLADLLAGEKGSPGRDEGGKPQAPAADRSCALCPAMPHQALAAPPEPLFQPPVPVAVAAGPWLAIAGRIVPAGPPERRQARAPPVLLA
ncbi:hypothetical protein DKG75_11790 [Zavarzinia compransoris]|uniref:DUF2946 domain-containing protein n=1 Tax=Zavarzinia compransoris TaxID=1264899 RepID=A0A317E3F2_9PROT|nr:hypothetical protein DKG75_11790 [Zavarzinia compransoris]